MRIKAATLCKIVAGGIIFLSSCKQSSDDTYLFAHMLSSNYGVLCYSVSQDGQNWEMLNDSIPVEPRYRGHPDLCKGADGAYYMIGAEESPARPVLWRSEDLISWSIFKYLPESIFLENGTGHSANPAWFGAPKLFYDDDSGSYLLTWHAPEEGIKMGDDWWKSMRTFYTLTPDFEQFTRPDRLFHFLGEDKNMATIDVIVRKLESTYYAIIKDERWPEDCTNGKTIRIATSTHLTGPYSNPGLPQTPAWHEAPSVVKKSNGTGWYIYAESYPNRYVMFEADSLKGNWTTRETNLEGVRHGCVLPINEKEYQSLKSRF